MANVKPEGGFRTNQEEQIWRKIGEVFDHSPEKTPVKIDNFPRYIRRQKLTRFLALYEIFKKILSVKGSIVECGVYQGFSLMSWGLFSAVMEPNNLTRRVYGFDTFKGFANVHAKDKSKKLKPEAGQLSGQSYEELLQLIDLYDKNRFLGHIPKIHLIKGDVLKTIPRFIANNKHLVISLLFLDMDLYKPTKLALQYFYPRMPKGAILAFDELDNPIWPGETLALLESIGMKKLKIQRMEFDPYIGYAIKE